MEIWDFILLLGPILEEKYGWRKMLLMMFLTTVITAIIHMAIFRTTGAMGASGIVFMYIILASFVNVKKGTIPLTFILIIILFIGREIIDSFEEDQISQLAHIVGGICGAVFGFIFNSRQKTRTMKNGE